MNNPITTKTWSPYVAGAGIGILSWFAFASADHPIGVTTAFESTAALAEQAVAPGAAEQNAYFAAKKTEGKPPKIDWECLLIVGVFAGALFSAKLSGDVAPTGLPRLWRWRFGDSSAKRLIISFFSGGLMMFGARLAQGCTSGHGISGTMQFAVSSWLFIIVAFTVATATAWITYGKEGVHHV